jgi:formylglycine-generating enzyme required for sulfatase activity
MRLIAATLLVLSAQLVTTYSGVRYPAAAVSNSSPRCDGVQITIAGAPRCSKPGQSFKDCVDCPVMVVVPAGEILMGSPPDEAERSNVEGPQHKVTISKALAVGKYEVTFAEWDACAADGGCTHKPRDSGWGRDKRPVINVSWDDVTQEYLPWLSKKTGQTYRLLTEAEWEYAARAGTVTPFSTGATIATEQANFDGTNTYGGSAKGAYRQRTLEVGSFPANAFGLHDMHGNVWEWVQDCFSENYDGAPLDGRAVSEVPGCSRVLRGGSWIDSPRVLRSAYRGKIQSSARFIYRGFRVLRAL